MVEVLIDFLQDYGYWGMLLLSGIIGGGAGFFYVCQLPFVAILASYLFAMKETKLSNVYFVLVNAMMLAIATHTLWLKL